MRISSVLIISSLGFLVVVTCGYLVARKYGVSVELTRNAAANAKAKDMKASILLQKVAADPKLTVGSQTASGAKHGKSPIVIAVVSRHILSLLVRSSGRGGSGAYPLLEELGQVDVEPVTYPRQEIPALISELVAVRSEQKVPALNGDLTALIEALKHGGDKGTEIVFY